MIDPAGWPPAVAVAVCVLAVHRITRLIVADRVTAGLRTRISYRDPGDPRSWRPVAGYFITCPWCVSVYVAAAVVAAAALAWSWVGWGLFALAGSSAVGLLGMAER